ncbi:cell envelope integrity protein TolA, partial [Mycobacterium tuberculosis]
RKEKAEAKAEAKALKERKLEEARALKALKTKQQEEARALKKKEREEAKALKIKQLEEAKAIKEKKLLNKKIIASKSLVLFADSEVKMIFLNFINKIETSFLSIGSFVIFERLVFEYNNIGELSLLCSEESLNHYLVYNDIFESFKPNTSLKLIYTEFNEKFLRLVKLIEKKYELQNDENAIYIAWSILRQSLNMYYHNLLANEFGNIFNAKQLTLEECISHYVQIETINVKSANNAGLLTHFLIYEGVTSSNNFIKEYNVVVKLLLKSLEDKKNDDFEKSLLNKNVILDSTAYSIHDTDLMSGN